MPLAAGVGPGRAEGALMSALRLGASFDIFFFFSLSIFLLFFYFLFFLSFFFCSFLYRFPGSFLSCSWCN